MVLRAISGHIVQICSTFKAEGKRGPMTTRDEAQFEAFHGEWRRYFPSSTARHVPRSFARARQTGMNTAEYSPLITVAYTSIRANREVDHLAIGFKRRNDGPRQTPKAEERAPARRAGIDARSAWRRFRPAPDRAGSPARTPGRARGLRGTDERAPHAALLTSQENAS